MRAYSARLMVWSECCSGVSVAMNVDPFERDTTRVATLRLPNSVARALGISSANELSSSGVGFQTIDFGSTGSVFCCFSERAAGRTEGVGVAVTRSVMRDPLSGGFKSGFSTQGSRRLAGGGGFYSKMAAMPKRHLHRAAHLVERGIDRRFRRRGGKLVISPYRGFGRSDEMLLRGRVLMERPVTRAREAESLW